MKILFDNTDEEDVIIGVLSDIMGYHDTLIMGVSIVHTSLKDLVKHNISRKVAIGQDELEFIEQQLNNIITTLNIIDKEKKAKEGVVLELCDKLNIDKDLVMGW